MSNINLIVVEGRLTADPTLHTTKAGKKVCKFTIANNRYYFQGKNLVDEVSFFTVSAWGPLGERAFETLKKGHPALVSGTIKCQEYQTQEGIKKQEVTITAANVKYIGKMIPKGGENTAKKKEE